jgi:hypothetical protein
VSGVTPRDLVLTGADGGGGQKSLLPKGYRLVPVQDTVDALATRTVVLKQTRIGRAIVDGKVVPGARIASFILTIAVPYESTAAAEYALDDDVVTLLDAIDQLPNLRWTIAEKKAWSERNEPCYDIELELPFHHPRNKGE